MKQNFKVVYEEVLVHEFEVGPCEPDELIAEFEQEKDNGSFDFSDGDLVSGQIIYAYDEAGNKHPFNPSHADLEARNHAASTKAAGMTLHERIQKFKSIMECAFSAEDVEILGEALSERGFFTAPASTKHHGNYEGGLFEHSLAVTEALLDLTEKLCLQWSDPRSPYLVGMLHDICKCDQYIQTEAGYEWNKNQPLKGHGDKSVILTQHLIALTQYGFQYLTEEEILCIRWHMGAFDDKDNWNAYNTATKLYPNVLYTHTADMIASQIKEC